VDKDPNCLAVKRFGLKPAVHIVTEGEHFHGRSQRQRT
jgi:hypothetical protein